MSRAADRSRDAARAARSRGDLREAARLVGKAFARYQRDGDGAGMTEALVDVGLVALDGGDVDTAVEAVGRALALGRSEPALLALVVSAASRVALESGDAETALRLHVGAARFATGDALAEARARVGPVAEQARAGLAPADADAAEAAALALPAERVLELAAARCP